MAELFAVDPVRGDWVSEKTHYTTRVECAVLSEHMELIFATFPEVLQHYVELRGADWKPVGVTWSYHPDTGEERVCFTLSNGVHEGKLEQALHFPVSEDGVPTGDAQPGDVSFRVE